MGELPKDAKSDHFYYQNVTGWSHLCELDPVAARIQKDKDESAKQGAHFDTNVGRGIRKHFWHVGDSDDESVPGDMGFNRRSTDVPVVTQAAMAPKTLLHKAPDSVLTARKSRPVDTSPAVVSGSAGKSSPQRKTTTISLKDSSDNADLVSGKRVLEVHVKKGAVQTVDFDDMSTMRQSNFTEVKTKRD
jgi:hypothetical protein